MKKSTFLFIIVRLKLQEKMREKVQQITRTFFMRNLQLNFINPILKISLLRWTCSLSQASEWWWSNITESFHLPSSSTVPPLLTIMSKWCFITCEVIHGILVEIENLNLYIYKEFSTSHRRENPWNKNQKIKLA